MELILVCTGMYLPTAIQIPVTLWHRDSIDVNSGLEKSKFTHHTKNQNMPNMNDYFMNTIKFHSECYISNNIRDKDHIPVLQNHSVQIK